MLQWVFFLPQKWFKSKSGLPNCSVWIDFHSKPFIMHHLILGCHMRPATLNHTNSVLLLLSLVCATVYPFETLLISYAFLGPLHYLTEISWLHDRKYFLPERTTRWVLYMGAAILLVLFNNFGLLGDTFNSIKAPAMFVVFALLGVFMFTPDWKHRAVGSGLIFGVAWLAYGSWMNIVFGVLLITLIHVFVFTGLFVWTGIRKTPHRSGYLFAGLYILVPILCFVFPNSWSASPTSWAQTNYELFFSALNTTVLSVFDVSVTTKEVFSYPLSIDLSRFIAVAYTYHYLNWFSKPTVIQWHNVNAQRWSVIVLVWLGTIGLYWYNYVLGFVVLLALSFAHVILEFPLNHLSLKQLWDTRKKTTA